MTTFEMIQAAVPTMVRPVWVNNKEDTMGCLVVRPAGDLQLMGTAKVLDEYAKNRNVTIIEIARVKRGVDEAVYARYESIPPVVEAQEQPA